MGICPVRTSLGASAILASALGEVRSWGNSERGTEANPAGPVTAWWHGADPQDALFSEPCLSCQYLLAAHPSHQAAETESAATATTYRTPTQQQLMPASSEGGCSCCWHPAPNPAQQYSPGARGQPRPRLFPWRTAQPRERCRHPQERETSVSEECRKVRLGCV